jgi:hypothetical protein
VYLTILGFDFNRHWLDLEKKTLKSQEQFKAPMHFYPLAWLGGAETDEPSPKKRS